MSKTNKTQTFMKFHFSKLSLVLLLVALSTSCKDGGKDKVEPQKNTTYPKNNPERREPTQTKVFSAKDFIGKWEISKHDEVVDFKSSKGDTFGNSFKSLIGTYVKAIFPPLFSSDIGLASTSDKSTWEGKILNVINADKIEFIEPKSNDKMPLEYVFSETKQGESFVVMYFTLKDKKAKPVEFPIRFTIEKIDDNKISLSSSLKLGEIINILLMMSKPSDKASVEDLVSKWLKKYNYDENQDACTNRVSIKRL